MKVMTYTSILRCWTSCTDAKPAPEETAQSHEMPNGQTQRCGISERCGWDVLHFCVGCNTSCSATTLLFGLLRRLLSSGNPSLQFGVELSPAFNLMVDLLDNIATQVQQSDSGALTEEAQTKQVLELSEEPNRGTLCHIFHIDCIIWTDRPSSVLHLCSCLRFCS